MNMDVVGPLIGAMVKARGDGSERSLQSKAGIVGPSDLGFCRQKVVLMSKGVDQSDTKSMAAANIGTAIHAFVEGALRDVYPEWWIERERITATFPSGAQVSGTPDILIPAANAVVDIKTVDGFGWVKRAGVSQAHQFQRHTYALAATQAKLLDESKPLYVGNLYFDRSGGEPDPYWSWQEYDPTVIPEIDSWIGDVIYALEHSEDASRDVTPTVCERICEFFTVCRGTLPDYEGGELIEDPERVDAIRMYVEAMDMEKIAKANKKAAKAVLEGSSGLADVDGVKRQIRWTHINPSFVEGFVRDGYDRMDIRAARSR